MSNGMEMVLDREFTNAVRDALGIRESAPRGVSPLLSGAGITLPLFMSGKCSVCAKPVPAVIADNMMCVQCWIKS